MTAKSNACWLLLLTHHFYVHPRSCTDLHELQSEFLCKLNRISEQDIPVCGFVVCTHPQRYMYNVVPKLACNQSSSLVFKHETVRVETRLPIIFLESGHVTAIIYLSYMYIHNARQFQQNHVNFVGQSLKCQQYLNFPSADIAHLKHCRQYMMPCVLIRASYTYKCSNWWAQSEESSEACTR